ncbi:hypothetical protein BO71DRAFT_173466 [Aspergillus ellipticus CBS 707.79]|uniref:Uncharacterized protein n=1 Tax=Aspergillus ellipticus CBS 707.79 TaxID=1448320 RepID=A0A319DGB3_9EURO|nr:hypothetical protein BO71DRAFT_173466 [Aspergillus ellipticus CBS 707.79]
MQTAGCMSLLFSQVTFWQSKIQPTLHCRCDRYLTATDSIDSHQPSAIIPRSHPQVTVRDRWISRNHTWWHQPPPCIALTANRSQDGHRQPSLPSADPLYIIALSPTQPSVKTSSGLINHRLGFHHLMVGSGLRSQPTDFPSPSLWPPIRPRACRTASSCRFCAHWHVPMRHFTGVKDRIPCTKDRLHRKPTCISMSTDRLLSATVNTSDN